jgi:drug/metabolite transporter (DMT)-like permease
MTWSGGRRETRGVALLCLSGVTLGGLGIAVSLLSSEGVSPLSQTFWRFVFAAIAFLVTSAVVFRRETIPGKAEMVIVGLGGGMMAFASLTYMGAISLGLPVPVVAFLSQMSAMFTVLLAVPLLGEKLTRTRAGAVSIGTCGVLLISRPWGAVGGNLIAELLVIFNAVNFAFFTIFNREYVHKRNYNSQLVSTWVFSGAALWSLPFLVFNAVQSPVGSSSNELGLLITMGILTTFVPYSLLNRGLRSVGAGDASVLLLLSPVSATLLSNIFLSEGFGLLSGVGSALILLSVIILAFF